jgi:hypothetical protein
MKRLASQIWRRETANSKMATEKKLQLKCEIKKKHGL